MISHLGLYVLMNSMQCVRLRLIMDRNIFSASIVSIVINIKCYHHSSTLSSLSLPSPSLPLSSYPSTPVVGIYVNSDGKRSRKLELLWHSTPTSIGMYTLPFLKYHQFTVFHYSLFIVYRQPYLLVFCESNLEVYNVETSEWTQTISIKKVSYYHYYYFINF